MSMHLILYLVVGYCWEYYDGAEPEIVHSDSDDEDSHCCSCLHNLPGSKIPILEPKACNMGAVMIRTGFGACCSNVTSCFGSNINSNSNPSCPKTPNPTP